jgi:uncharacterized membrane protein YqiK
LKLQDGLSSITLTQVGDSYRVSIETRAKRFGFKSAKFDFDTYEDARKHCLSLADASSQEWGSYHTAMESEREDLAYGDYLLRAERAEREERRRQAEREEREERRRQAEREERAEIERRAQSASAEAARRVAERIGSEHMREHVLRGVRRSEDGSLLS